MGRLVRNILYPPPLTFKFDIHWKLAFFLLFLYGIVLFGLCCLLRGLAVDSWYFGIFKMSQVASPIIPAVFVIGRAEAAKRLQNDGIYCVNLDRIAVAGKVKIFCFDKTGTLTKSGLEFHGIKPLTPMSMKCPMKYIFADSKSLNPHNPDFPASPSLRNKIISALGCCHELDIVKNEFGTAEEVGNEVDRKMFAASGLRLTSSEGGRFFVSHPLQLPGSRLHILRRFEFDRTRMTMSVIVENETNDRFVFSKGSYEMFTTIGKENVLPSDFDKVTDELAALGYYMLGVGWKRYDGPLDVTLADRDSLEKDILPLGLLLFLNDMKEDTGQVINELKDGDIRPVIITGDNALTATKIARDAEICSARRIVLGSVDPGGSLQWSPLSDTTESEMLKDVDQQNSVRLTSLERDMKNGDVELAVTGEAFYILSKVPALHCRPATGLCSGTSSTAATSSKVYGETDPLLPSDAKNDQYSTLLIEDKFVDADDHSSSASSPIPRNTVGYSRMHELLEYTRIFARMKPQQKVEAVRLHMSLGITAMCGDGANDAAALRAAHVGVALSSGARDASAVASFSTSRESLTAVVQILREGRASLATSMAAYKSLILNGEICVLESVVQDYFGAVMNEFSGIFCDVVTNIGLVYALIRSLPAKRLSPKRPTCRLLGVETVVSVVLQIVINTLFLSLTFILLFKQDWFLCKEFDNNLANPSLWWLKCDNYEALILTLLLVPQWFNSTAVYNFGFDYRRRWTRNIYVCLFWILGMVSSAFLILADPNPLSCLFRVNCGDASLLSRWMDLGRISSIFGIPFNAPAGCPCDQQLAPSSTCEAEYSDCTAERYNQTYHHNIVPWSFRWIILSIVMANTVCGLFAERFFVVGPVRRFLRRMFSRKTKKTQRTVQKVAADER